MRSDTIDIRLGDISLLGHELVCPSSLEMRLEAQACSLIDQASWTSSLFSCRSACLEQCSRARVLRKMEEVALLVLPWLDNSVLQALSTTTLWPHISNNVGEQYFWYLRTQLLVGSELTQQPGEDWKTAYYLVESVKARFDPFTPEVVNNQLARSILIQAGYGWTSEHLAAACGCGDAQAVSQLLKRPRVNPLTRDSLCLRIACEKRHVEIVRILLADGRVNVRTQEDWCLRYSTAVGCKELSDLLTEYM